MKQWYKSAGVLTLALIGAEVMAQTHYGTSVGTVGDGHVFIGVQAGATNQDGQNTFVGREAGQFHTTGAKSTFVGYESGQNHAQGQENTFLGAYSGKALTGERNISIGSNTGENYKGNFSTLIGNFAGAKGSGNDNIFIGNYTGYQTAGNGNVLIGLWTANEPNSKSNNNTMIGYEAGMFNKDGHNNSFFGAQSGSYTKFGNENSFFGSNAGWNNENGSYISAFGSGAGISAGDGQFNTYLGAYAGTKGAKNLTNATAVGAQAAVTTSNSLVLGYNANVGIGTSAPTYQLHLSTSSAAKLGSSSWTIWSDKRLKKDISDFTDGLELLKQIKPVWFRYNGEAGTKSDKKFVGVIAQDMQKIAPYTIGSSMYQDSLGNKTEYLDYDANAVTYILINSVKEQQKTIEEKEAEIQELSNRLAQSENLQKALIARLEKLEKVTASPQGIDLNGGMENRSGANLEQNAPNGFSQSTTIKYFIPQSVKEARIDIYTVDGVKVQSYNVKERGDGSLNLNAKQFKSGMHVYDLVTDGISNGARKMLVD